MIKYFLILLNFFLFINLSSQTNISGVINKYAAVTNVDLCNNQFAVDSSSLFLVGDSVLILQMKGATMDTTNTAAFGNLLSLNDAGKYEYNIIATIIGNVITFANEFQTPYNALNIIQVVSIPQYIGNVNVNAMLSARPWNGLKGGILIFKVFGDLTLNANINVTGRGFRPGINTFLPPSSYACNFSTSYTKYAYPAGSSLASGKGEGISSFYTGYEFGRGKQINGGGGGNDHNSGGGGGAGYGAGGIGGRNNEPSFGGCKGYSPGIGGQFVNATTRFIFSGAGGAGHGNNYNTTGATAGGLVVISANAINGNNRKILANGNNALEVNNDGAGGGGGGGSIFLNSLSNSNLNLEARGGNGGNMNGDATARCQGPGGGGGGGLIIALSSPTDSLFVQGGSNGTVINSTAACNLNANSSLSGTVGLTSNTNGPAMFTMGIPFISDLPLLSSLPDTVAICPNTPLSFVVTATGGNPSKTFQWQLKPSASFVWSNVANGAAYTGSNSDSLTILNPTAAFNTNQYRILVFTPCDSVYSNAVYLKLSTSSTNTINASICSGTAYTLPNGTIVNSAGTYLDTLQSANGCDSIISTNLTISTLLTSTVNTSICTGENYILPDGSIINAAGTYLDTLQSVNGCDSIITTNLSANPNVATTVNAAICTGSSYTLPSGSIVNAAGTYIDTLQSVNTCDSVITINLTTSASLSSTVNAIICSNETYTLPNGTIVNSAATYLDSLLNASGCDSVVTTNLTVNLVSANTINASICTNENYTLPDGSIINAAGTYIDTLQNVNSCDSVITTNLIINTASTSTINATICSNENYSLPNGSIVNTAGTYLDTLQNINSCDSVVTTNLTVNAVSSSTINTSICAGENYTLPNGSIVNTAGTYLDTLQNINTCDSVVTTNLTVNAVSSSTINASICAGENYTLPNGSIVNSAGIYLDTLQNINTCDSVITTTLTISTSLLSTVNASICTSENYTLPNGSIVNTAGTYLDTVQTLNGCDSVVTTNLLINIASATTVNDTICSNNSYTLPSGNIVNTAGTYIDTLQNVNGCDSIVTTVLVVNPIVIINTQSANANECIGNDVLYFVNATNANTYQWQVNTGSGFTNIAAEINDTLGLNSINVSMSGNQYRCIISNNCNTVTSNIANLVVSDEVVVVSEPNDVVICPEGPGFSFDLTFNFQYVNNFQWQIDTSLGFQNLNNTLNFSGTNTNSLTVSVPYDNVDGANFRLVYTGDCGSVFTSKEINVRISEPNPVNGIGDVTFCLNEKELLEVDYDGTNYVWNDAAKTTGRFLDPETSGEYIVSFLQNSTSCLASDTINVVIEDCLAKCVVTAPTGFSPNASGKNDEFKAIYTCTLDYFEMVIANRWGEIVYVSNNPNQAWDGKYKSKPAPIGTYAWQIKYNKKGENKQQSVSGNVMLMR